MKLEGKRLFGRQRCKRKDSIKMYTYGDLVGFAQEMVQ